MKKKVFVLLSSCLALLVFVSFAYAGSRIKLLVNGQNVESDVPVQIIANRTMVPVRALANALGATVSWDSEQGIVSVNNTESNRIQQLEAALAQTTAVDAVNQWANGVKTRNGALQYALLSSELREKNYQDYAELGWITGTSSPWVEEFTIIEMPADSSDQHSFQVDFKLATSTGTTGSDLKRVMVRQEGEKWVIAQIEDIIAEEDSSVKPDDERGANVKQIPYQSIAYTELSEELQALVDTAKFNSIAQVIKGEGDTQYALICLGQRNTGGYDIEIASVEEVDGEILVIYQEKRPVPGQMVIQVLTYPWKVIQVDSALPISIRKMV